MKSSAPVAKYLLEFKKKYKKKGKKVVEILVQKLEAGEDVEQAIRETIEVTHFQDMLDQDTKNAIAASMAAGMGRTSIPLLPEMETPWDPSELTLSEKLHSIHREIHQKIGNIVQQQVRLHNHASDIRKALYDGYNGQKTEAVLQQELPQYIKGAVDFIRRTPFEKTDKDCRLRLIRRIERQAKALTSKPLKTAYKELAIQLGKNNEDGLKRAVYVAVQEKSRYVAERIARTESARAWADGFIARYETDDTVAAYRWEVSSAHPCTDVCDMYANADLWGLGKGIYPKDQCPTLPAHPHCLCYLSPIYEGEVDLNEQQDLREEGGNHWLQKQSKDVQRQLLGVQGAKAWEAGRPWQDVLRNYSPAVMKSRVSVVFKEQTKAAKNGRMEEKKRFLNRTVILSEMKLLLRNEIPPTDEYLFALAKRYKQLYTLGEIGEEKFYDDHGEPIYPPNDGAIGQTDKVVLNQGAIVDRYGSIRGRFLSENLTAFNQRSLPRTINKEEYHVYRVVKTIINVKKGIVAPWFGQDGLGIQYRLQDTIKELLQNGMIIEVSVDDNG